MGWPVICAAQQARRPALARVSTPSHSRETPTVHDIPHEQYAGSVAGPLLALMALGFTPSAKAAAFPFAPGVTGLLQSFEAKREQLKADGNAIVTLATSAGGYTQEQRDKQTAILAELQQLDADIAMEKQAQTLLATAPAVSILDPVGIAPEATAPKPFRTFGDQLSAIRAAALATRSGGAPDPRLVAVNDWAKVQAVAGGLNETVGSEGGFAIQTDYSERLMAKIDTEAVLWPAAEEIPLSPESNGTKINLIDESSRATGSRWGGVQVYWEAEATATTATKPKLYPLELTLQKLFGLAYRTNEIGQDWTASGAILERAFTSEMAFSLDDAAVRGTGAGRPMGYLNAACLVTVSKESGQVADTVLSENIFKMFARMPARSKRRANWYINGDLWPQIFQLHQVIGTGGSPLFIPTGALGDAPGGTILGRPVIEIEQASAPGDVGDIGFIDMGEYLRISKAGIQAASSLHVEFLTDQEAFRWTLRTNGAPGWKTSVTPYKGSLARSPFVVLEAR